MKGIVDSKGYRRLSGIEKVGRFIVYRSLNPDAAAGEWEPLHFDDVPDLVKGVPNTMTRISKGEQVQVPGDDYHYRAEMCH